MQPINYEEMILNREKLFTQQKEQQDKKIDGVRLHLGSGHAHLENYLNVDLYSKEADIKADICHLPFKENSVVEIMSRHCLEHIPVRQVFPTLKHWFELLSPGGTINLMLPDIELCCQAFLEAPEQDKWNWNIFTIYGAQTDVLNFNTPDWSPRNSLPISPGQFHIGGFSLGYFIRMLEDVGFKMVDGGWYDDWCTPSFFVYAMKPEPLTYKGTILEQDCAIGTFTNKISYITKLWESCQKQFPHVQFITRIQRGPILDGMTLLREDFIKSGKRFVVYLDDDIQFLNPTIINDSIITMFAGKYACTSVYSTFLSSALTEPYNPNRPELVDRPHKQATGYYIGVDMARVGHILPDSNLPYPNQSVDYTFSAAIREAGFEIAISKNYVYHQFKNTLYYQHVIDETNAYLRKRWGDFYYFNSYDNNVIGEWHD